MSNKRESGWEEDTDFKWERKRGCGAILRAVERIEGDRNKKYKH